MLRRYQILIYYRSMVLFAARLNPKHKKLKLIKRIFDFSLIVYFFFVSYFVLKGERSDIARPSDWETLTRDRMERMMLQRHNKFPSQLRHSRPHRNIWIGNSTTAEPFFTISFLMAERLRLHQLRRRSTQRSECFIHPPLDIHHPFDYGTVSGEREINRFTKRDLLNRSSIEGASPKIFIYQKNKHK